MHISGKKYHVLIGVKSGNQALKTRYAEPPRLKIKIEIPPVISGFASLLPFSAMIAVAAGCTKQLFSVVSLKCTAGQAQSKQLFQLHAIQADPAGWQYTIITYICIYSDVHKCMNIVCTSKSLNKLLDTSTYKQSH